MHSIAPSKYKSIHKFLKVRISCSRHMHTTASSKYESRDQRHVTSKVRIPTKYNQRTLTKVQISVSLSKYKHESHERCTIRKVQVPETDAPTIQNRTTQATTIAVKSTYKEGKIIIIWARETHRHTPYGPYNLPHMVLCTKQGHDNA